MKTETYIRDQFEQLQAASPQNSLHKFRQQGFQSLSDYGIPQSRHEEWKYTRIGNLFSQKFSFPSATPVTAEALKRFELPGHEAANVLVFINGHYSAEHSFLRSPELTVQTLAQAIEGPHSDKVRMGLGHSAAYLPDGINALNAAFVNEGVFLFVPKGKTVSHPVYIYTITDARQAPVLSQPRSLVLLSAASGIQLVETYGTLGNTPSFTNQVLEIVVEEDARAEYYKIQNDAVHASQVSTTHFHQTGKSYVHTVTVSLNGGMVRNNLNIAMGAPHCEAHLYGLYFQQGKSHVDNHTVVDNLKPHCFSNELYKGILTDEATGVFNGKIYVRPQAQKINAFQSNKNILLSPAASVNTKPQLEIFADDVKCSHGCTIGRLDQDSLFFLRSRGIPEKIALALLVQAFAADVLEQIRPEAIREHIKALVAERLEQEKV